MRKHGRNRQRTGGLAPNHKDNYYFVKISHGFSAHMP